MILRARMLAAVVLLCVVIGVGGAAQGREASEQAAITTQIGLEEDFTGIWRGRCLLSMVEAHVRQQGERIHGVALVHTPSGDVNQYHFKGEIHDGKIVVSHHKGHRFVGEILSEDKVSGAITTAKKGYVFELDAERVSRNPTRN